MRRASRQAWCEAPRPLFYSCPGGGRVGRSTVSPQHADPSAARDTPIVKLFFKLTFVLFYHPLVFPKY
ncbi:MAG: hypothetical protein NZ455_03925 [Bacteroidia bacterium]|nr:hypothetical protein [Bacteroidia bacterium]